jgi:hypothetical protein
MLSVFNVSIAGIAKALLALFLCVLPVAACSLSAKTGTDVSRASVALTLLHGVQRGIGESQSMEAIWISDEEQWNNLIASIPAESLEIMPEPVPAPDIDFTKYGVLLIRLGEKPNGGYGLTLTADKAAIKNREARIPVRLSEPEEGYMYTQAIVYPHLIIKMEKGAFDGIAVIDQNGSVKLRLSVK